MSSQHLEIYIDPKDPRAYLALPGTAALLQATNCQAQWLPMQASSWTNPGPEPAADASRGERHRWFRANYQERELRYYAQVHNLPLTNLYRTTDSSQAAIALMWLAQQPSPDTLALEFLQRLTQSYWASADASMDDTSALITQLGAADGFSAYQEQQGSQALTEQLNKNAELGVIRGPAFRLDQQLYIGREHLPLLHTLISESLISE